MGLDPTNNGATNMINLTIKHWDLTNKLLGIWARKNEWRIDTEPGSTLNWKWWYVVGKWLKPHPRNPSKKLAGNNLGEQMANQRAWLNEKFKQSGFLQLLWDTQNLNFWLVFSSLPRPKNKTMWPRADGSKLKTLRSTVFSFATVVNSTLGGCGQILPLPCKTQLVSRSGLVVQCGASSSNILKLTSLCSSCLKTVKKTGADLRKTEPVWAPHLALLCCTSLLHWNPMNPAGAPENCVEKINTSTRSQHVYKIGEMPDDLAQEAYRRSQIEFASRYLLAKPFFSHAYWLCRLHTHTIFPEIKSLNYFSMLTWVVPQLFILVKLRSMSQLFLVIPQKSPRYPWILTSPSQCFITLQRYAKWRYHVFVQPQTTGKRAIHLWLIISFSVGLYSHLRLNSVQKSFGELHTIPTVHDQKPNHISGNIPTCEQFSKIGEFAGEVVPRDWNPFSIKFLNDDSSLVSALVG